MLYFEPDFDIYEEDEIDLESETENCDQNERELVKETNKLKMDNVKTTEQESESESPVKIIISFKSFEKRDRGGDKYSKSENIPVGNESRKG
jgi:hypothetical protein